MENAEREANSLKKEAGLQAKEEAYNIKRDAEIEIKQKESIEYIVSSIAYCV
ncbi:unnamed protein product, partial [marine sediment metagenome]